MYRVLLERSAEKDLARLSSEIHDRVIAVIQTLARNPRRSGCRKLTGRALDVNLGKLRGGKIKATWFDPRTGESAVLGEFENTGRRAFDRPGEAAPGNDWVLVMESLLPLTARWRWHA